MSNRGIVEFYYTRNLPPRSVAIAQVQTAALTPAQLTGINNTPYLPGSLGIWKSISSLSGPADFVAPDYGRAITISGATTYYFDNQFFEITNQADPTGDPLFYFHQLPLNITNITILDLTGAPVATSTVISGNALYHSLDGAAYRVRFIDANNVLRTQLLTYTPALSPTPYSPSATGYVLSARTVEVSSIGAFYLRFTAPNGYQALPPYNAPSNTPWFPRIRFSLKPIAPEWARQVFLPRRPFMLAGWVSGTVLDTHLVEFDRKRIFNDPQHLPDLLVFDTNNQFKFALDGSVPGQPQKHGTLYNWKRGQIRAVDFHLARIEVAVELALDDIVFGFYSYNEPDVVYQALDCNPFTNPSVKNRTIQFYYKTDGFDSTSFLYHQLLDEAGIPVPGLTNDASPATGNNVVFATVVVGASTGLGQFTIKDIRVRGGGLASRYQGIPEAVNFWDLGFWDGKPYPLGGALAIYLPQAILDKMSRSDTESRVRAVLPQGVFPIIRYYDSSGEELA